MYKHIDDGNNEEFQGFSYTNEDGDLEYVDICDDGSIKIIYNTCIYKSDIHKLIKALQLTDKYLKGINNV